MKPGFRCWPIFLSLALLCALAYAPALPTVLHGGYPFNNDALAAFGPWREFTRQNLQNGVLPLWNAHVFCGMPFLANGQSAVLYPPGAIYLILPLPWGQLLDAYFHNLLLACGGYVFTRALGLSRSAAFLTAALLGLGGAVSARIYEGHMTWHVTRAYIPWLLWSMLLLLRHGRVRHVAASVLCCGLMLSAGHLAVAVLGCTMACGLAVAYVTKHRRQWRVLPWNRLLLTAVLAAALGAVSLLPLQEAGNYSVRSASMPYAYATWNSASWRSFVRLLLPDLFGGNHSPQWSIRLYPHEEAASIGLVAALLALGAPFLARRDGRLPTAVAWLYGAMLLASLLALGNKTPVYRWAFDYLPLFRSTRVPPRWLELWFLSSAILAGFSWDGLRAALFNKKPEPALRLRAFRCMLCLIAIACFGFMCWLLSTNAHSPLWMKTAQWNAERTSAATLQAAEYLRNAALRSTMIAAGFAGVAALILWRCEKADSRKRLRWQVALLALLVFDVLWLFWRSARPLSAEDFQKYAQWPPAISDEYLAGDRWATDFHGKWERYAWNDGLRSGIDLFNGYDPFGPRPFFRFASALEGQSFIAYQYQPQRRTALLRVAGVTHTLSAGEDVKPPATTFEKPQLQITSANWELWRHSGAWPRVYLTTNVVRVPIAAQLAHLEKIAASGFTSAGQPVVVAPGTFASMEATPVAGRILHWQRNTNRYDIELRTDAPSALVIGDSIYAGWRAYLPFQP